jgi:4-hydroxy-2-oxoheptanedioate aldolase
MSRQTLVAVASSLLLAALSLSPIQVQAADARLNRMIELWEQGKPAIGAFARFRDGDAAIYYSQSQLDFVIFDMEHGAADFTQYKTFLQFMVDKAQLLKKGNLQPNVTPLARIPSNGSEKNQWVVKQALDAGAFGLMSPHIRNVEEARALVANSRYPQKVGAPDNDPPGERGAAPANAARYWGIPVPEYFERADAWPLDPKGEIAVIAMIESAEGVKNIHQILTEVKGISAIFIGPNDLSTSLGYPGQMDHPETEKAVQQVLAVARELNVPCGILVFKHNIEKRVKEGFKYLVIAGTPGDTEEAARIGLKAAGR